MIEAIKVVKTTHRAVQIIDEFRAVNLLDLTTKVGLVRRGCECGCSNAYCAVWNDASAYAVVDICHNCGDDNAAKEEVLVSFIDNESQVFASIEINEEEETPFEGIYSQTEETSLVVPLNSEYSRIIVDDYKVPEDVAFGRIKKITKAATKKAELVRVERDQALTSQWKELEREFEKGQKQANADITAIKKEVKEQIDYTLDLIDEVYKWANRLFIAVFALLGLAALASVVFVGAYHQIVSVVFCVVMVLVLVYQSERDKADS